MKNDCARLRLSKNDYGRGNTVSSVWVLFDMGMDANRLSRHWSDVAVLADHDIGKKPLSDRALLADVVKHKKVFFYLGSRSARW